MQSFIQVNPFRCQMWQLHDRIDAYINEETCRAEIESFLKHGQLVPVLGEVMGAAYLELAETRQASVATIKAEEEKFFSTVASGSSTLTLTAPRW